MKRRLGIIVPLAVLVVLICAGLAPDSLALASADLADTQQLGSTSRLTGSHEEAAVLDTRSGSPNIDHISQFGGRARIVGAQGNYAYILGEGKFTVLDVSNPLVPVEVGLLRGIPNEVTYYIEAIVHGNLILIVGSKPQEDDSGYLQIINVANPSAPTLGGYLSIEHQVNDAAASGNYAYLVVQDEGMRVIDVSSPSAPVEVGFFARDHRSSIVLVGDYAYLRGGQAPYFGWVIVDISEPAAPSYVRGTSGQSLVGAIVIGSYLYAQNAVYDVSDPAYPQVVVGSQGHLTSSTGTPAYSANHLYVTGSNYTIARDWLTILDVSNPESPTVVADYDLTFPPVQGGIAVVGNHVWYSAQHSRIRAVDVSDKTSPSDTSAFYDVLADSIDVAAEGNYAYSVGGDELSIIDVSNPSAPSVVGSVGNMVNPRYIAVNGDYAYVTAWAGVDLHIINIANKAGPYEVSRLDHTLTPRDIAVVNDWVYLATGRGSVSTGGGVRKIDVSDKSNPRDNGRLLPYENPHAITISGDRAYVWDSDSTSRLNIYDVTTGESTPLLGYFALPGWHTASDIAVAGAYAYIALEGASLTIVDVADPTTPMLVTTMSVQEEVIGIEVSGNNLYVSSGYAGIQIFDIKDNPEAPVLVGHYDTDGFATDVAVDGDMVYVADGGGGLEILRFEGGSSGPALPDYTITAIEVTQAIQDLQNSVPLIAGKTTYARVHVRNIGAESGRPVTARLCLGNHCISPSNRYGFIPISTNPDRGELDDSFYFLLPDHWVDSPGSLTLTATVNTPPELRVPESNLSNNSFIGATAEIRPSFPLYVRLFNVNYSLGLSDLYHVYRIPESRQDLQMIRSWLMRAYPVAEQDLHVFYDSYYLQHDYLKYFDLDFEKELLRNLHTVNEALASKRNHDMSTGNALASKSIYYGVLIDCEYPCSPVFPGPFAVGGGLAKEEQKVGSGYTGSPGAKYATTGERHEWDKDGSYGDWVAGHEIGHILIKLDDDSSSSKDYDHLSSNEEECGAFGPNEYNDEFPYPNGLIGGRSSEPSRYYGFDVGSDINGDGHREGVDVYSPDWHDMMAYCPRLWISNVYYEEIYEALEESAQSASYWQRSSQLAGLMTSSTESQMLLITAVVDITQDTAIFRSGYLIPSQDFSEPPTESDYSLNLLDPQGNNLSQYPVHVGSVGDVEWDQKEYVLLIEAVPWVDGTAQVVLSHNGQTLATLHVSPATPEVTIAQPNGGEVVNDTLEVAWTASDDDGDPLEYVVQYSADDGQSWDTLSLGITNTLSIEFDATQLPGSDSALVRVLASDGVNTGIDQSDQPFSVALKVPEAVISSPADGAAYVDGQTIGLFGDAYDVEDGYLQGDAIEWTSDIAGPLGVGPSAYPENMPVGVHEITMTATDSDGNVGTDTIAITIEEAPLPPELPSQANPGDGLSNIPVDASLSWTGGDPNNGDPVTYDIYFGTTNPPALVAADRSATTYDPPGDLLHETTYYWQIVATDDIGLVAEGPIWSFTTAAPNIAPDVPSNPDPADGADQSPLNQVLDWTAGDPDGDPLTYAVYFGAANPPPLVVASQAASIYDPPGDLAYGTDYYWQIIARDDRGGETPGPVWQFTTVDSPPPLQTRTYNPSADAYVFQTYPTRNYGAISTLRIKEAAADFQTYLKFNLDGLACADIQRATLRMYVTNDGPDAGTIYATASDWTEKGLTWGNAPGVSGSPLDSPGAAVLNQWVEFDVSEAVTGDGRVGFGIVGNSTNIVYFNSRESARPPELVVEYYPLAPSMPAADFAAEPLSGPAPLAVQFSDASTGCPSTWAWTLGDGQTSTEANPSHTYANPGQYTVSLSVGNGAGNDGEVKTSYITVEVAPPAEYLYFSSTGSSTMAGVAFAPSDILQYNKTADQWEMYFDGSDVKTTKNLGAFSILDDDSLLLSWMANQPISGLGTIYLQDIARFIPTSTGDATAGSFECYFDGSDVGLTTSAENIDAIAVLADGRLLISTIGTAKVPGPGTSVITAHDEDILAFTPSQVGCDQTAGDWELFFDGTAVPGLGVEDINGFWIDPNAADPDTADRYITILGAFNIGDTANGKVAGNGKDVIKLTYNAAAPGDWVPEMYWDGSTFGFGSNLDGVEQRQE